MTSESVLAKTKKYLSESITHWGNVQENLYKESITTKDIEENVRQARRARAKQTAFSDILFYIEELEKK